MTGAIANGLNGICNPAGLLLGDVRRVAHLVEALQVPACTGITQASGAAIQRPNIHCFWQGVALRNG